MPTQCIAGAPGLAEAKTLESPRQNVISLCEHRCTSIGQLVVAAKKGSWASFSRPSERRDSVVCAGEARMARIMLLPDWRPWAVRQQNSNLPLTEWATDDSDTLRDHHRFNVCRNQYLGQSEGRPKNQPKTAHANAEVHGYERLHLLGGKLDNSLRCPSEPRRMNYSASIPCPPSQL